MKTEQPTHHNLAEMILTAALVTASLVINTHCRPLLRDDTISKAAWAWRYLETYGYIPEKLASANKENILAKAIADFQSFSDINMTGGQKRFLPNYNQSNHTKTGDFVWSLE